MADINISSINRDNNSIQTNNATFKVYNRLGEETTTTYSFEATYLEIIPDLDEDYIGNVEWIFGDGTTSREFKPKKSYDRAGVYKIQLVIYDCRNLAIYSTFNVDVTITDFVSFDILVENTTSLVTIQSGIISDAFTLKTSIPHYQKTNIDVKYHIDNSDMSKAWRDIDDYRYAHLDLFYTLYRRIENYNLGEFQYEKLDKVVMDYVPVYVKVDDTGSVVETTSNDVGAIYAGSVATQELYISHDTPQNDLILSLYFDNAQYDFPESYGISSNVHNSTFLKIDMICESSTSALDNTNIKRVATSTGLVGEGLRVDTFNITDYKFINTPFQLVVTPRQDSSEYTIKSYDDTINGITWDAAFNGVFYTSDKNGPEVPTSLYSVTSGSFEVDNVWHTKFEFTFYDDETVDDDYYDVHILFGGDSEPVSSRIDQVVRVFQTQPYNLYRQGEEFSAQETIKSLRFQEVMQDNPVLFDELIGGMMGDAGGDILNNFGSKTYERIKNYNNNIVNVDKCHIFALNSSNDMLGRNIDRFNSSLQNFPVAIGRYANLFSIDDSNLIGYKNTFQENFDARGDTTKTTFGKNLGEEIDLYTYSCSAETDIVAFEKFSETFQRLTTSQPVSSVGGHVYPLSSYNDDFGWGLVLPSDYTLDDIPKFYRFFEFNPEIDGTIINNTINFDFEDTNVTFDEFKGLKTGPFDMFSVIMYDTLTEVLSTRPID